MSRGWDDRGVVTGLLDQHLASREGVWCAGNFCSNVTVSCLPIVPPCLPPALPTCTACRYCEFVRQQVGSPDAVIPPRPPMTRYKREIAVAAEEQQAAAAAGAPAPNQLSRVRHCG